jgi:hypothetical protein
VLQAALQAAWAEILVETASSFHGLDSPSKAALKMPFESPTSDSKKDHFYFVFCILHKDWFHYTYNNFKLCNHEWLLGKVVIIKVRYDEARNNLSILGCFHSRN